MDEGEFWIALWRTVAAAVIAVVLITAGCSVHKQRVLEAMVEKGANPIDAKCSLSGSEDRACILRHQR